MRRRMATGRMRPRRRPWPCCRFRRNTRPQPRAGSWRQRSRSPVRAVRRRTMQRQRAIRTQTMQTPPMRPVRPRRGIVRAPRTSATGCSMDPRIPRPAGCKGGSGYVPSAGAHRRTGRSRDARQGRLSATYPRAASARSSTGGTTGATPRAAPRSAGQALPFDPSGSVPPAMPGRVVPSAGEDIESVGAPGGGCRRLSRIEIAAEGFPGVP